MTDLPTRRDMFELLLPSRLAEWLGDTEWRPTLERLWEESVPVDITRKDDSLVIRASMAGFEPAEIDAQIHDGVLSIRAEHKEETEEKREQFYRRERRVGFASRTVSLPEPVVEDQVTAEFKNGVLTLSAPIADRAKAKHIEIKQA